MTNTLNRYDYQAVAWRWLGKAMAWRSVAHLAGGIADAESRRWLERNAKWQMRECARFGVEYLKKHQNEQRKAKK